MAAGEPQENQGGERRGGDPARERLVAAFGRAASEHGYTDLTVEDVLRYARVSREAFDAHFESKEQGLIAAQDAFLERLWGEVQIACRAPIEWPFRVRAGLEAAISLVVEASGLARVFAVEAAATSLAAAERQLVALDRFSAMLHEGRRFYPKAEALPEITERVVVGGVFSIITGHLLAEEPRVLASLEPQLVELVLTPYVGPALAEQIAQG